MDWLYDIRMGNSIPKPLITKDVNAFENDFNGSGVYAFVGLVPSNTFDLPIYIGSSDNLKRRICKEHLPDLRKNKHPNNPLQNYYNKYGKDFLTVYLLESCDPKILIETEQYYVDKYGTASERRSFNILPLAGQSPSMSGKKHSDESKSKMRIAKLGKIASEETKKRQSAAKLGKKRSKEFCDKQSVGRKGISPSESAIENSVKIRQKPFSFISPNGEVFKGENVTQFAREQNLDSRALCKVQKGRISNHKGWRDYVFK